MCGFWAHSYYKTTVQSDSDMQYQSIPRVTHMLNPHRQCYDNTLPKVLDGERLITS